MIRSRLTTRCVLSAALTLAAGAAYGADLPVNSRGAAPRLRVTANHQPPADDDAALISIPTTPLLPGSTTLPGYYGRAFDYNYQGSYYGGGPYPEYFWRLPYACGTYGYC